MKPMILLVAAMVGVGFKGEIFAQKPYRVNPNDPLATEKAQVRRAVVAFEGRLLMRDLISLTGELEEDRVDEETYLETGFVVTAPDVPSQRDSSEVGSTGRASKVASDDTTRVIEGSGDRGEVRWVRIGRLTPEKREVVTASAHDYSTAERRALRGELKAMFDRLPLDLRVHLIPEQVEVSGSTALVEAVYYFRPRLGNADLARVPAYAKSEPQAIQVRLRKVGEQWLVEDLTGIVNRLTADVPR